ncbi:MAG: TylF/MycF family methyltransferase [Betaproteobacteria bacterium]|nr:TylF/MycF family methyltransferase [Betaproteobacteria bacterium]
MRNDLMNAVVAQVNAFHIRPHVEYDYQNIRRRMIFESLTQGVQYVINNAVEGDIAEFGTFSGFSTFTIARAMAAYWEIFAEYVRLHNSPKKSLCLFDSFQGLPPSAGGVDAASPNVQTGRWKAGTFTGLTKDELFALCASTYDQDKIHIFDGWYAQTLPQIPAPAKFAMVHLDCDLYSSTIEVLDHLLARKHLADGCVLFFDDWNCNQASPRFGQRRAWREATAKHNVEFSDCGDYAVLGHKFIVHTAV